MDTTFCALHCVSCFDREDVSFLLCCQYVQHSKGHPPAAAFNKQVCSMHAAYRYITKDATSWRCQIRLHLNDLHGVCYLTAARQLR